jgi:cation:H+ antiporter
MFTDVTLFIISLFLILVSAEIFTNGVEALGKRLALSQAVVGSIFAAVGTAMPETILPFVAIFIYGGDTGAHIGVGAILGAPFMLSTLAFFLVGITVLVGFARKKRPFEFKVEAGSMKRDLIFFICMYSSAISIPMLLGGCNVILAFVLIISYFVYVWLTFRGESSSVFHVEELYFSKMARSLKRPRKARNAEAPEVVALIFFQVICALALIVGGAHIFIAELEKLSMAWGMNPLLFALLLAPVATELPEKFNSITWTLKGKDTLAAGNITGAMVFQSTFPVSLGLMFTDWSISGMALFSAILSILAALMILADISLRKKLSPVTMMSAGLLYLIYAIALVLQK